MKLIEALKKQYNRDYVSLMPTNLYGPGDNYDLETSHVLPAMIRKFYEAKLNNHSDVVLSMEESLYNVRSECEISIKELVLLVQSIIEHKGKIIWDTIKPNGTPRKFVNSEKLLKLGYRPSIELKKGIEKTYNSFKSSQI